MKCIVKGCKKEASKRRLCEDHFDPDNEAASDEQSQDETLPARPAGARTAALFGHTALLVCGKIAGRLVRAYNNLFALTSQERAQILDHIAATDMKRGRRTRSLATFENAVKLDPENPEVYRKLGKAYLAAEQFEKARDTFQTALKLDPKCMEVHEALGEAHYHCEDYKSAVKHLEKAFSSAPENHQAAYLLGLAHDKLGAFEKAVKFLQAAIDLSPRNVKYYYSLGFVYECKGMKDEALENFKKAVELERDKAS
ncbi:MAG TPA: tetratricopeptide repeat protein [Candidatus Hydrogenedentes bacterium]|nr:tetratricopeptide repeat protein [Candidatus Hydrogenedentota bacterium]